MKRTRKATIKTIYDVEYFDPIIVERNFVFKINELDEFWEVSQKVDGIDQGTVYKNLNLFDPDNRDHIIILCSEVLATEAAAALGSRGGKSASEAKVAAARANGAKGGRPRKSDK